jgi:hypothetical protein
MWLMMSRLQLLEENIKSDKGFSAIPKQISNFGSVQTTVLCESCILFVSSMFNIHVFAD